MSFLTLRGPYRYAIFDRDSTFNEEVVTFLEATGLKPKRTSVQAPWQNGVAERWIGSARRDCFYHLIALNEAHVRRLGVNSLRTTMRIELISDWIRTHHRRDRSKENRRGRNWNRWHGSAAYIIDTSGKQPREHAVKFPGRRMVDHYRCVPRPRGGR